MERLKSTSDLQNLRRIIAEQAAESHQCIRVCMTGCRAAGAMDVKNALVDELDKQGLGEDVEVRETGCQGFCSCAPVAVSDPGGTFLPALSLKSVPKIVAGLKNGGTPRNLLYTDPKTGKAIELEKDVPFYKGQVKSVLRNCGVIDPTKIEHYLARDGYAALEKSLSSLEPEEVIEAVRQHGLRGRGGAGFPTHLKWTFARKSPGTEKYLVCNGDEGDPGAFMDRALLEGDPHGVIEGMIIAGYAIGATVGYFYVRAEYPIAVKHLKIALEQVRSCGLVGENILGSGFSFDLRVKEGAGAFVCGEETALLASIEGKRGLPRTRPPFPAQSGLWGKPTNINNVETYANVPIALQVFDKNATIEEKDISAGTKIFSLAGKVCNTGLVEVPVGVPIHQVVYEIGGGVSKGGTFKAVQMGGPSGGCVPAEHIQTPIDYGTLDALGAIMGSGGLVVMDETTCMVDAARYFLAFTQDESCGKCVPCRLGTKSMLETLTRICDGGGQEGDVEWLEEHAVGIKDASLCGLGQTAPNPVLSTIRYFRDEYDEHIREKRCRAKVCKELINYYIDPDKCQGCLICGKNCPVDAIEGSKKEVHVIDQSLCTNCGLCYSVCPDKFQSVRILSGEAIPAAPPPDKRAIKPIKKKRGVST